MNLLYLLGDQWRRVVAMVFILALVALACAGAIRWRSTNDQPAASRNISAARPAAPSKTNSAAPEPNAGEAQATAVAFCDQYFADSWQESAAAEQARVAPYLTPGALSGWRAQLTPVEVAGRQTAKVTSCAATGEGPAPGGQLGFFLDAQVVTSSTGGTQTGTAAAEIFLVPVAGAWKVNQVRT